MDREQYLLLCLSHAHPVDLLACTLVSKSCRASLLSERAGLFRSAAHRIGALLTSEAFLRDQECFHVRGDGQGTALEFIREISAWEAEACDLDHSLGTDSQISHGLLRNADCTPFNDPSAATRAIREGEEQHRSLGPAMQTSHEGARFHDFYTHGLRFDTTIKAALRAERTAVIEMRYCKEKVAASASKKNPNKVKFVLDVTLEDVTPRFIRLRRRSFSYVSPQCSSTEWCPCLPRAAFQHLMSMHPYSALRGCEVTFVTATPTARTSAVVGRQIALFYELVERYQLKGQPSWIYYEPGHELECRPTHSRDAHESTLAASAAAAIWFHAPPLHKSRKAYTIGTPTACLCCGQSEKLRKCMGCERVAFCNATCQRAVWDTHSSDCKYFKMNCSDRYQYHRHPTHLANGWNQSLVAIRKFVYTVGQPLTNIHQGQAPDVRCFLGIGQTL
jgi:hypothetical protein